MPDQTTQTYRVATDATTGEATVSFDSVNDFVANVYTAAESPDNASWTVKRQNQAMSSRPAFTGVANIENAIRLAGRGLRAEGFESFDIAQDVIRELHQERVLPEFETVFDVSGMDVDMDRYLTGEPECMIEYPIAELASTGPVVTMVVGMNYSAIISKDAILQQGQFCVALALALQECGYSLEIWSEIRVAGASYKQRDYYAKEEKRWNGDNYADANTPRKGISVRVKVLEAGTTIEPAGLMFALAHPSMLRIFGFAAMHLAPEANRNACSVGNSYGNPWPIDPKSWPENSIILNTRRGISTNDELRQEVIDQLVTMGILKGGE